METREKWDVVDYETTMDVCGCEQGSMLVQQLFILRARPIVNYKYIDDKVRGETSSVEQPWVSDSGAGSRWRNWGAGRHTECGGRIWVLGQGI